MPKLTVLAVAILSALIGGGVLAKDRAGERFLTRAISGNYAEVQLGELAQKNGQGSEAKAFGQMLVAGTDHGNANQKAIEVAKKMQVTPPSGPDTKQRALYDRMSKLSGAEFDKAFASHMVSDHKKDISEYKRAAKMRDDIATYARDELPTLEKHLQTAQQLEGAASAGGSR